MNNQSPLIPQGSLLEQKNKGRTRVKIAVFLVLAIHGIGLIALLMAGCQREKEPGPSGETNTVAPPIFEATNVLTDTTPPSTTVTTPPATTITTPVAPAPDTHTTPSPLVGSTEYKVVKGDNFTTIGAKFKVTAKAIAEANPGVDSSKLQVGQTLHIPPPPPATTSTSGTVTEPAAGEQLYTVVSGDNLTTIAKKHNTTAKAIRSLNNLKTDQLKVGQKLRLPPKSSASATTAPAPPAQ